MSLFIGIVIGIFVGAIVGMFTTALMVASKSTYTEDEDGRTKRED